jgi:hypothetical protein
MKVCGEQEETEEDETGIFHRGATGQNISGNTDSCYSNNVGHVIVITRVML